MRDGGHTLFVTTQCVGEAELCHRVGLLSDGRLAAVGTPEELRREAFGGGTIELALAGHPSGLAGRPKALEGIGRSVEVRQEEGGSGEPESRVRLLVDDADLRLPQVLESLDGATVRSADVPKASFDDVYFRLVERTSGAAG